MKYLVIILITSILFDRYWASFFCPPAQNIYPCECHIFPQQVVRCDGISNLESVREALEGHFTYILPRLRLTNIHSFSLPSQALGSILPRRLVLSDSNIRNIDDNAFEGQSSLALLIMAEDRLEDIPAEALKRLTDLQTLNLGGNFLMRVQQGSLSNLNRLRFLVLSDNRISEIDKGSFPRSLQSISLSRNLLRTLNGSLNHLQYLKDIFVTDNRLTSVRGEFMGLNNLNQLFLDRNHISEIPDSFANHTAITHLSLSNNRIQEIGKALRNLTKLKLLNLSFNYITDLHWRMFEKLKDLEILDLSGNYIKTICPALKPLRSLRELNLSDMNLKYLDLDCFHNMKTLKSLDLSNNRLSNIDAVIRHPLPVLFQLRLSSNRLTVLRHELKYLKGLRELDISFNNFSSFKAHYLSYNRQLATLKLGGNPWKCTESVKELLEDMDLREIDVQGRPAC